MHYVMSDIHGNDRRFRSVMKQIRLKPEDKLYVLGDVVDRYGGGIRILRQIMKMENAQMILGNHEYMMLRALGEPRDDFHDDGRAWDHWYRNGGQATYDHFKYLDKSRKREILDYLKRIPLSLDLEVEGRPYKLAHGAPPEAWDGEERYKNPTYFAVWKRLEAQETLDGDYTLIFGHTPTRYLQEGAPMHVWYGDGRICIDCGSGYPESGENSGLGRLACLRLEDGKVFYSEENYPEN